MPTVQDLFFQNNKPLAVQDSLIPATTLSSGVASYDLQDLREDREFNETSERFLNSLGEGETVDELFNYFRGADWNLADATRQFAQTRNFTDQQKQDYIYLRKKYSNADVGGPGEWAKTIAKTGVELITDPTLIMSALFIPWSGGTSVVARAAAGKGIQKALQGYLGKEMGKSVAKKTSKIVAKLPGQKLAKPLSGKAKATVLMTEGAVFGGSFDYVTQGIEVETDQKEEIDLSQTAVAAGLSATVVGGVLGTGKLIGKVPSFHNSLINRRLEKIEMDPNYKGDILEKTADRINKVLFFVQKPTSAFINKMARSPVLNDLINSFRHDASKRIIAGDVGDQPVLGESVNEEIVRLTGSKLNRVKEALAPLMPEESTRKKVLLPFSKRKFRKSIKKGFYLTDEVNNDLTYFLRTNRTFKMVNGNKVKLDANIIKSGKELQSILDDIYNESLEAGIKGGKINNYFPRRWLQIALEDSPEELIQHIHKTEKISMSKARQLVNEMMAPDSDIIKIGSNLNSNLTKSRKLTKINDEQVSQYLDNDVMNVLNDYIFSATKQIVGKKRLGGSLSEFTSRFINPIQKQLAKKNSSLTGGRFGEVEKLKNMYLISTGQKGYIKSRVGRFFHNTATILAQTSLLPLATITSLPELFTPLLRGLGSQKHRENIFNTMADYNKVWWNDIKTSYGKGGKFDVRSTEMKELNGFLRAMDMGTEDRAMAAFGQGMGPRANKVQNAFFKAIGLQDWTKYVQLVSYQTGKNRIYDNLLQLSKAKENKLSPTKIARLTDELNEFNINPEAGLGWLKAGANPSLKPNSFYRQSFMPGAARYVDEVIMNPTAGANQKPLLHSLPSTRWAFGLMGFPTAFSNTVLKNLARDLSKDLRDKQLTATPQILAGLMTMTMAALAGNTIRTGGKNIEDLDSGEKTITDELQSAWKRAGLYGPFEYSVNYENSNKYNNKIEAGLKTATGPSFDDVYDAVVHAMGYDTFRGPAGVVFERMPFATLLRKLFPEKYKEFQKEFRKLDKETAGYLGPEGFNRKEKPNPYVPLFSKGGIVEGEDNVPFTKEDPADRINPYTGEPYQEQMNRLGFSIGGVLARQLIRQSPHLSESAEQIALNKITAKPISSRGTSDKDKLGEFINLYAKDDEGMFSPAVKSLIEDTPDNLKGKGLAQFINSRNFKQKVKDEELNILNLNKYIDENPQANLEDVIDYASKNKVIVKTSEYADSVTQSSTGKAELFLEAEPVSADTKLFMVTGKGKMQGESYVPVYAEDLQNVQALVNKNDVDIANDLIQIAQKDFNINLPANLSPLEKLSELKRTRQYPAIEDTLAKQIYEVDPIQKIGIDPERIARINEEYIDRAFDVYALRSRDGTYRIYADAEDMTPRIMSDRDIPQVEGKGYVLTNEAETKVQMQSFLEEEGLLKKLSTMYEPKWKYIVDQNMPGGSNYREFVFNNDNAKIPSVFRSDHFLEEKNYLAHALVRDRKFQDGSLGLHIDELQSDLHQKGSKYGYATPESIDKLDKEYAKLYSNYIEKYKPFEKEMRQELLNMIESYPNNKGPKKLLSLFDKVNTKILKAGDANSTNSFKAHQDLVDFIFHNNLDQKSLLRSSLTRKIIPNNLNVRKFLDGVRNRATGLGTNRDVKRRLVPNSPFKETWHQLSIKKLLKRAVDEGYDSLSISNSKPIVHRYRGMGDEGKELFYDKKVKNYMQKLAKSTGGEFKIKYLDNEYNIQGYKIMDDEFLRSYVIEITPELKELVSTKGLASFRKGGKVSTNEQMNRLGFNIGGVLARQLIKRSLPASKPVQQKILKDTSDISKAGIQDKALLTEYKKNVDDMWELEQKGLGDELDKLSKRQDALQEQMNEVGDFYKKEYTNIKNFDVNNPSVYRWEKTDEYKLVKNKDPYYTGSEDVVYKLNPEKYTEEEVENQIIKLLDENLLIKDDQDIGIKTLIKVASNNSPRDATILKTLDKNGMLWIDSPGGYYKEKLYGAAKTLYAKGDKYPTKSGKNMLPFERLARKGVGNDTFQVGTDSKPFFVNPNKLDNLINFSSSNKDYFRHRLEFNREQFLDELTNLKDRIIERGYFGKGTNSSPIQIEVSRFGDVIIPEGNHRLALALISKQEEVPIILYYKQGAERLKTNLSIDNLSSLLDKGKTGYKTNKEFGILKRKVNKQFKNVEAYTDEYVKKQGYSLGGKVSTNAQMDRLGFKDGEEVETKPLLQRILQSVERASPEEEKEFLKEHPYYGEVIGNKVYINEQKLRNEGSTGNYVEDMFFGEALHKLKESSPKWYDRLYSAANKDPDVMRWRDEAYEREVEGGYKGTKQQHWDESRFDQVVGGFLLGRPDANIHTMRGWDRNALPYGTHFRKELEDFEKELGRNPEK